MIKKATFVVASLGIFVMIAVATGCSDPDPGAAPVLSAPSTKLHQLSPWEGFDQTRADSARLRRSRSQPGK